MNWPRVKWILIVMLLAGNLLLTALYLNRREETRRAAEQFQNAFVTALSIRGVTLAPEVKNQLSSDARRLYATRDIEREETLAVALLGQTDRENLGGRIYEYTSASGQARFWSGGQFLVEWLTRRPAEGPIEADAAKLLLAAGFPADPVSEIRESLNQVTITVSQRIGEWPIFDADVNLVYEDGILISLSGKWLWGDPLPAGDESPCPVFGIALLRFTEYRAAAGAPVSVVESMRAGYLLSAYPPDDIPPDYICVTPVWRITADGHVYDIDAQTGEEHLSRGDSIG